MKQLSALLPQLAQAAQQMRPIDLLPPPRLDGCTHVTVRHPLPPPSIPSKVTLRPNPLAIMIDVDALPAREHRKHSAHEEDGGDENGGYQSDSEDADDEGEEGDGSAAAADEEKENFYRWALHISFGNDEIESQTRVEFKVRVMIILQIDVYFGFCILRVFAIVRYVFSPMMSVSCHQLRFLKVTFAADCSAL